MAFSRGADLNIMIYDYRVEIYILCVILIQNGLKNRR